MLALEQWTMKKCLYLFFFYYNQPNPLLNNQTINLSWIVEIYLSFRHYQGWCRCWPTSRFSTRNTGDLCCLLLISFRNLSGFQLNLLKIIIHIYAFSYGQYIHNTYEKSSHSVLMIYSIVSYKRLQPSLHYSCFHGVLNQGGIR